MSPFRVRLPAVPEDVRDLRHAEHRLPRAGGQHEASEIRPSPRLLNEETCRWLGCYRTILSMLP